MAVNIRGFWALLIISASLLLLLPGVWFNNAPSRSATGPKALIKRALEPSARNIAVAFGTKPPASTSYSNKEFSPHPSLVRRIDDIEKVTITWDDALRKGQNYFSKLGGSGQESKFLSMDDLESPVTKPPTPEGLSKGGWALSEEKSAPPPTSYHKALESLNLPKKTVWRYRTASNNVQFSNECHTYLEATGGYFYDYYNAKAGIIITSHSFSPRYFAEQAIEREKKGESIPLNERLPIVHRMSDVIWILWADTAAAESVNSGTLKYIFRYAIKTANTKFIIERAAENAEEAKVEPGEFNKEWPGYSFSAGSKEFQALLGTDHGTTMVHLIVTHRNEFDKKKTITNVNIFTTEDGQYHMLWTLG